MAATLGVGGLDVDEDLGAWEYLGAPQSSSPPVLQSSGPPVLQSSSSSSLQLHRTPVPVPLPAYTPVSLGLLPWNPLHHSQVAPQRNLWPAASQRLSVNQWPVYPLNRQVTPTLPSTTLDAWQYCNYLVLWLLPCTGL